jgi:hypothetical protein
MRAETAKKVLACSDPFLISPFDENVYICSDARFFDRCGKMPPKKVPRIEKGQRTLSFGPAPQTSQAELPETEPQSSASAASAGGSVLSSASASVDTPSTTVQVECSDKFGCRNFGLGFGKC